MDYGTLNALGIMLMSVFGLWAFYMGSKKLRNKKRSRDEPPGT